MSDNPMHQIDAEITEVISKVSTRTNQIMMNLDRGRHPRATGQPPGGRPWQGSGRQAGVAADPAAVAADTVSHDQRAVDRVHGQDSYAGPGRSAGRC